jgi:hypothetical protein
MTNTTLQQWLLPAALLLLLIAGPAAAQDEEALFGGEEEMISEGGSEEQDHEEALLTSEEVQIGGNYSSRARSSLHWGIGGWPQLANPFSGIDNSLLLEARGSLFFDARPQEEFRVFGKVKSAYPYYRDPGPSPPDIPEIPDITVFELYADTHWNNRLFIRAGKQVAMWGVGRFYSPADFLSLSLIDPEEPEAEREGPLALKLTLPLGVNNLYLHLVAPPESAEAFAAGQADMGDLAYAPRAEVVLGSFELGLGGYWSAGEAPRAMATVTGALGLIDLFAEGVFSWGSDRSYVDPSGTIYRRREEPILSATAGLQLIDEATDLSLAAQYYYNGEGYAGIDSVAHRQALLAAASSGTIAASDLQYTGRHYAALNLGWSGAADGDLSLGALWQANLADRSGVLAPQISWRVLERLSISGGARIHYGPEYGEFSYGTLPLVLALECSLSGSF